MTDPLDLEVFRWHRAARDSKLLSTRGTKRGFTFYIDVPRYVPEDGQFRVDKRKMRDCVAPRFVHMLDATFNGLVVEHLAAIADPTSVSLVAVHDAWILAWRNDTAWEGLAETLMVPPAGWGIPDYDVFRASSPSRDGGLFARGDENDVLDCDEPRDFTPPGWREARTVLGHKMIEYAAREAYGR